MSTKKRVTKGKEAYDLKDEPCETCPDPDPVTDEVNEPVEAPEEVVVEEIRRPTPEFPLTICLIGAPGSGKEEVARKFVKLAESWFSEQGSELVAVDNPGNMIARDFDQAMGWAGGYREHLWTYFSRLTAENQLRSSENSFVTSGTIIENIAHAGIEFENIALGVQSSGLVTPQTENEMQKIQATMAVLTFLMLDGFRYNFAFHLPLGEKIIIPGQEEDSVEDRHAKRIDTAILSVMENFNLGIQKLEFGTPEEKAQEMFDTIKGIMDRGYVVTPVIAAPEEEPEGELDEFGMELPEVPHGMEYGIPMAGAADDPDNP